VITETTLRELGFAHSDPTCWSFGTMGRGGQAIAFRVHVRVTAEEEQKLAAYNTTDPTAHLHDSFDVNGDTMEDPEFRDLFQRWKAAHRAARARDRRP